MRDLPREDIRGIAWHDKELSACVCESSRGGDQGRPRILAVAQEVARPIGYCGITIHEDVQVVLVAVRGRVEHEQSFEDRRR